MWCRMLLVLGMLAVGRSRWRWDRLVRGGAASPRFTGNKLYAEYLRREGRGGAGAGGEEDRMSEEARERREVDHQFRDF